MSNKVIKSVSFNIKNTNDAAMLKAIKRRNFSGYVKKLILEDLRGKLEPVTPNGWEVIEPGPEQLQETKKADPKPDAAAKVREIQKNRITQTKPFIANQNQPKN